MFQPGNSFADYLLLGISFLPLLTAVLIVVRKAYGQEPFNFLAVICLLCFFQDVLAWVYPVPRNDPPFAVRIITLLLFLFYFLLFRSNLGGRLRYSLNLILAALLSSLCTYWSLKGWGSTNPIMEILPEVVLILLLVVSLRKIFTNDELGVFRHPLFWIEGGTLFYFLIFLLLQGVGNCCGFTAAAPDPEKKLFLDLADLVRHIAYLVAVFLL